MFNDPRMLGLPHSTWRPGQKDAYDKSLNLHSSGGGVIVIEAPTGCHPAGQEILMYDGSRKKVEDIKINDILLGPDGNSRNVTECIYGYGKIFSINPVIGETFFVNENHILTLVESFDNKVYDIDLQMYIYLPDHQKKNLKLFRIGRSLSVSYKQKTDTRFRTGFTVKYERDDLYYGFSLTGDGRYVLGDFTVTHNTGKSGIPTALGAEENVLVLAHNHGLLKQYESNYGFSIIMGKPEYPCELQSKVKQWGDQYGYPPTAADCHMMNMFDCPASSKCGYLLARQKAAEAKRSACTYKYAALSKWISERDGILVMDEAHDCYEELIEFSRFTMDENMLKESNFPRFPLVNFGSGGKGDLLEGQNRAIVSDWMMGCMKKISIVDLFSELTQESSKNKKMFEKLSSGLAMIESGQPLFYKCSAQQSDDWRSYNVFQKPGSLSLEIRSLDVKSLVKTISGNKTTTVMMSATIGNPKPLMGQLGISKYQFERYAHPTPKNKRPVYDLGFEKMTKANLDARPSLYKEQANAIAKFIQSQDSDWRSIILTSSNYKIGVLRNFLRQKLNGRVTIPEEGSSLKEQINSFKNSTKPGEIAIGTIQGWGSGISLDGNIARISGVAGIAFANPGDRFDQLRMSSAEGKAYAFWNSYCGVVQATGRVSRGELDENGDFELNVSFIADGSATTPIAKSNFPAWFNEAIVKV
jgi:Rad3-related DNA helicase